MWTMFNRCGLLNSQALTKEGTKNTKVAKKEKYFGFFLRGLRDLRVFFWLSQKSLAFVPRRGLVNTLLQIHFRLEAQFSPRA